MRRLFGLKKTWISIWTSAEEVTAPAEFVCALQSGATDTMSEDPPQAGPKYEVLHWFPKNKPVEIDTLDVHAMKNVNIQATYCLLSDRKEGLGAADLRHAKDISMFIMCILIGSVDSSRLYSQQCTSRRRRYKI